MKTKLRPSAELAEILRPHCPWEMTRFLQSQAIDSAIAEAAKTVDFSLQSVSFAFDADPGSVATDIYQRCDSKAAAHLASLLGAKSVLDSCPDLPDIRARLAPLFDELHAARAAELEAASQTSLERQRIRDDLAAKRALAIAELDKAEAAALAAV